MDIGCAYLFEDMGISSRCSVQSVPIPGGVQEVEVWHLGTWPVGMVERVRIWFGDLEGLFQP